MKKKIIIVAAACLLLCGAGFAVIYASTSTQQSGDLEVEFMFDSARHTVHSLPYNVTEVGPKTFAEMDENIRNGPHQALIIGEVVGPSINRIIDPAPHLHRVLNVQRPTGFNHVITPILVHHIVFSGDNVTPIEVGDVIHVLENYYFVTPETSAYFSGIPVGDIMTNLSYWPMESGNRYLIYLFDFIEEPYQYGDKHMFNALRRELVYLLSPILPANVSIDVPTRPHYAQFWQDAMEMYGHLESVPWVTLDDTGGGDVQEHPASIELSITPEVNIDEIGSTPNHTRFSVSFTDTAFDIFITPKVVRVGENSVPVDANAEILDIRYYFDGVESDAIRGAREFVMPCCCTTVSSVEIVVTLTDETELRHRVTAEFIWGQVFEELPANRYHSIGTRDLEDLRFRLPEQFDGQTPTNLMVREHRANWTATGRHLTNINPAVPQIGAIQSDGIWALHGIAGSWQFNPGFRYSVEFHFGSHRVVMWFVVS